mgnify:CR=1 FL=1
MRKVLGGYGLRGIAITQSVGAKAHLNTCYTRHILLFFVHTKQQRQAKGDYGDSKHVNQGCLEIRRVASVAAG